MSPKTIDLIESGLLTRFMTVPYRHGGRTFAGMDCYGLIIAWYKWRLGIELFDVDKDYPPAHEWDDKNFFLENQWRQWEKVSQADTYDVVLLNRRQKGDHAGIYLRDNKFLHMIRAGCVIGRLDTAEWSDKIEGFYRYKRRHESLG